MARKKSDDLTFSSEKLEAKERQKSILTLIAALLLIAALAVGIALVVRSMRGERFSGGTDTLYPYSWRNDSKGVLAVEIDHSASPGQSWIAVETDRARMAIQKDEKQPEGSSSFKLTPTDEGRYNALFLLINENNEASCRLDMLLETTLTDKGVFQTEVLSSALQPRQVTRQGGADSYYPYSFRTDENGYLVVTVEGAAVWEDWNCISGSDAVAMPAGLFYEEGNIICFIMPGDEPGTCAMKISTDDGAVTIDLELELTQELSLLVRSDSIEGGDVPPPSDDEEEDLTENEEASAEDAAEEAVDTTDLAAEEQGASDGEPAAESEEESE